MNVYFSNALNFLLGEIRNNTSNPITHWIINNTKTSLFSFVDFAEGDKVSFISEAKLKQLNKEIAPEKSFKDFISDDMKGGDSIAWTTNRIQVKIGRFFKKLIEENRKDFDDFMFSYYPDNHRYWKLDNGDFLKKSEDVMVEEVVNHYKSATKKVFDSEFDSKLVLLSGNHIAEWYNEAKYFPGNACLHESCMKKAKCHPYFEIYVNNPDVCQMLVFKETDDLISMRALIWTLADGSRYMDRIYSANYSDMNIFVNYARKNGWGCFEFNNEENIDVQLKNMEYEYFPYMDTFKYFNKDTCILSRK
jgi:hypothetical protein